MNKSATTESSLEAVAAAAARWVARRDAGMTVVEQHEFERWLNLDSRHASAWEHYSNAWAAFDRPRRAGATDAVLRRVNEHAKAGHRRRLLSAGACVAVIVLAAVTWRSSHVTARLVPSLPSSVVMLQPEKRTLPDGSVAELKAGAEISVKFDDTKRRVTLQRGEAHFQVMSNRARPFIVEAASVHVLAVGTAFAVQLGGAQVEVLVTEGSVAVERIVGPALAAEPSRDGPDGGPTSDSPTKSVGTVDAGQRLVVELAPESNRAIAVTVAQPVSSSEMNQRLAWRSPRLEFSSTPLAEAIALMNQSTTSRKGGPAIRLALDPASPGLADEPISGLFRADNAEAFVHVLELSLGINAERGPGNEIVLRRRP